MNFTTPSVSQLSVYPIKSSAGIHLSSSWIDELGLSFDRRFVVVDENGIFITARTETKLCLIQANIISDGLVLTAPDMPKLVISYKQMQQNYQSVDVWSDAIHAQEAANDHHQWFSHYLNRPCKLLHYGDASKRKVPAESHRSNQLAFADGYPILLISKASLAELNSRSTNPVTMSQFRPNIVVDDCDAFAEDSWSHIRIGEVEFELKKPCTRCVFTTINPATAEKHPTQEPITTLKSFRQGAEGDLKGEILFGQNLVPLNQGQIKCGDLVTVISKKSPPVFQLNSTKSVQANELAQPTKNDSVKAQPNKKVTLNFESWNKEVKGNCQTSILDQAEDAGMILPYSCRAGMCGRCKVKLVDGTVKELATDGLTEEEIKQGYILICSSIPQSNLLLTK